MSDGQKTRLTDALSHIEQAAALIRAEVEVTQPDGQEIASLREQVDALSRRLITMRGVVVQGRKLVDVYSEGGDPGEEIRLLARAIGDAEATR